MHPGITTIATDADPEGKVIVGNILTNLVLNTFHPPTSEM